MRVTIVNSWCPVEGARGNVVGYLTLQIRNLFIILLIGVTGCSPAPKVLLVDGTRKFSLDLQGGLLGGDGFTASQNQTIAGLLGGAKFPVPDYLKSLLVDDYDLVKGDELVPLEPVKVVVATDLPKFRWKAVPGATFYEVFIRDHRDIVVKRSGKVEETEWIPKKPLAQAEVFHWRVTAGAGKEAAVSHWAKFAIPGATAFAEIEASSKMNSHLLSAIAFARCGAIANADIELAELEKTAIGADLVQRWRSQLK